MAPQKRVLITGCSSGFGRILVTTLLERGWLVYASLRRLDERRENFAEDLARFGEMLQLRELDVTNAEQRATLIKDVQAEGIDCLVNNAGFGLFGALEDVSDEQYRQQFEVNFFSIVSLTRSFLPALRARQGSVVFLSSVFGYAGFPLTSPYCASKYALEGFAESLYHELTPHKVRVYLIEPGGHRTSFGANVQWGEGQSSAFKQGTDNYQQMLAKKLSGKGVPPHAVVKRVVSLIEGRSSKLRHPLGRDARSLQILQSLVPERLRSMLLHSMFRKIFWKEASS
jgi:NAD(P)-dependent dehydrogenase (short-subunit alcohol dehydrogenase family)